MFRVETVFEGGSESNLEVELRRADRSWCGSISLRTEKISHIN